MTSKKLHKSSIQNRVETSNTSGLSVEAASPGTRFLAGMTDLLIAICCSTIIAALFDVSPIFYEIAVLYFLDIGSIVTLLLSSAGFFGIFIFFLFSFVYYTLEGITGVSLGKYIFSLRIAGERKWYNAILRSLIKSIPPLSVIDFVFAFKKLKYTQRLSDEYLELGVAKLNHAFSKPGILLNAMDRPYIVTGLIFFFLPLITYIVYNTLFLQLPPAILPPDSNSDFVYSPSFSFLMSIFISNFYLAYIYYIFGGFFLSFPMTLQVFFQGITSGILISGVLKSQPHFILFGIIPHLIFEALGFAFLMSSGLILTQSLMDLLYRYRKGMSLDSNRTYMWLRIVRIIKLIVVGTLVLFIASIIEIFVTPYILITFYYT